MPGMDHAFYPQGTLILSLTSLGTTANLFAGSQQGMQIHNFSTANVVCCIGITSTVTATAGSSAGLLPGMFIVGHDSYKTISTPPNVYLSACTTAASISAVIGVTPGIGIS